MSTTIPATKPDTTEAQARAVLASHHARAWQLGTHLGRLLNEHEVARPAHVDTRCLDGSDGTGQVRVSAEMAAPADLFRLARGTDSHLYPCRASDTGEQAYVDLGLGLHRYVTAYWAGPTSTAPLATVDGAR